MENQFTEWNVSNDNKVQVFFIFYDLKVLFFFFFLAENRIGDRGNFYFVNYHTLHKIDLKGISKS